MGIDKHFIQELVLKALPDAELEVKDMMGDGYHYEIAVVSQKFTNLSSVEQHRLVYKALAEHLDSGALHAISLKTSPTK